MWTVPTYGGLPTHRVEVEQRLADLTSKADHLAQVSGQGPLNWHQFTKDHEELRKYTTPTTFSMDGAVCGAALGGLVGVGASAASIAFLGFNPACTFPLAAIGGLALGGTIGGAQCRSSTDHREEMVDAYGKYLESVEKRVELAHGPQVHANGPSPSSNINLPPCPQSRHRSHDR